MKKDIIPQFECFTFRSRLNDHWDVYSEDARVFCIRGKSCEWILRDYRNLTSVDEKFRSWETMIDYLTSELMG